jgi:hypothetical protein
MKKNAIPEVSKEEKDFHSATFRFEGRLHEQFMELVWKTHSSSQMELLRRIIALTSNVVEASEKGETLILRDKKTGTEREVIVLW